MTNKLTTGWEKSGKIFNMVKKTFLGQKEIPGEIETGVVKKVVRLTIVYSSET